MYNMVNTAIICPACGEGRLIREEPKGITYSTETYAYLCPECGFVKVAESDEAMQEYVKNQDAPKDLEDVVNHPSHYETGKFECFDVMREIFGDEAVKNFCTCNAFKYLYRHTKKNGIEDIRKAKWYIDHFLEIIDEGLNNE